MEKVVFHLLEDSPSDVMEEIVRMNPKVTADEKMRGALILEETYQMLKKGMNNPDLSVTVKLKKRFGDIIVELVAKGEAVNPITSLTEWVDDEADLFSVNILKANRDRMGYTRRNGSNVVSIQIHDDGKKAIYFTIAAMILGIVLGGVFKTVLPAETLLWLEHNVTSPIETMFMNSMIMMAPPVIFFSIINGITHMSETADIGKIGARMIGQSVILVMLVAFLSVFVGQVFFSNELTYLADLFARNSGDTLPTEFSLIRMIVDIVPPNLVEPFKGQNMLQVLFLALFFGVVVNKLGEKARIAQEIIEFMDGFCLAVMGILIKVVPGVVLLTMMGMMFRTDISTLLVMGKLVLVACLLVILSLFVFAVIIALYGKLSPSIFLKNAFAFAPIPLALRSSNAALPQTLHLATQKFGVSPSLASFALPVGTQLHMAGACITLALPALMTARVFDHSFTFDYLLYFSLYVFIFAYTMPPIPGGIIVSLSALFIAIGVPPAAVAVFLCVEPFLDMGNTVTNVICNVASSVLLAKKFDMLDEKIYNAS